MATASSALFQPGARFFANINGLTPGTDYDQFKTPSPPNLSGAQLLVLRSFSFPFVIGQKFVIITNTGESAQSTAFANLPQAARITNSGVVFQISYTGGSGNDVELTVVETPFAPSGGTRAWDGGGGTGNHAWNAPVNWEGNTLPNRGDDLVFPSSAPANTRINQNNLPAADAVFNRLWFGGQGNAWNLQGGGLKIFGGVVATNALPAGEASFGNASVELIESQTWSSTNMVITLNAPLLLGGHVLTIASAAADTVQFQNEVLGPGSLVAARGNVSFFSQVGASNVTVTIQTANVFAGFGPFTGPPWQMSAGKLRPGTAHIPGLQMTGGVLDLQDFSPATIAGNLTLNPASTVSVRSDSPNGSPLVITGQINLNGARLDAASTDLSLLGDARVIFSNAGPSAVTGTFAGLPEGAVLATTNELNGLLSLNRISYIGGDGNDVTLTPVLPTPTGQGRVWTGAGGNAQWDTAANWSGNTPPVTGDDVLFPVDAAGRTNTNATPGLVLNSIVWEGSNYVHSGTLSLLNGLRHDAAGGTNSIVLAPLLAILDAQTWAFSNTAATLRVVQEASVSPASLAAPPKGAGGISGLGPLTKTGAGRLEMDGVLFSAKAGLIVNGGTVHLRGVDFAKLAPLILQGGHLEAVGVNASSVTATNGELAIRFAPSQEEGTVGGLFSAGEVTFGSNATVTVDWTNEVLVAMQTFQLALNGARLNLTFPPTPAMAEVIRLAQYATGELTGTFANLPEGAVTNLAGRDWQIHYAVELPGENPATRFITLSPPVVEPRFTSIQHLGGGDILLRGTANAGVTVNIEGSMNFDSFQFLGSTVVNGASQFTFIDSAGALTNRFYRVQSK